LLYNLINRLKILPRWIIIVIDLSIIGVSTALAYLLRFNFVLEEALENNFFTGIWVNFLCGMIAIAITKSYAGIVRYTGIEDGIRILYTATLNLIFISGCNFIYHYYQGENLLPFSVILIAFFTSFIFLFFYRLLVKSLFSFNQKLLVSKKQVAIFGAGSLGMITKQVLDTDPNSDYRIIAFLEDNERKIGKVLNGTPIYNARDDLDEALDTLEIDELIISVKNLTLERKNELVDKCLVKDIKIRTIPPVEEWVKGELSLKQIKDLHIEDLLGRESIKLDNKEVARQVAGRTVLITGAAGSIGSEIARQVLYHNSKEVIFIDQAESPLYELERDVNKNGEYDNIFIYVADITNGHRTEEIIKKHRPDIIYHAAAYKHVPMMEENPQEAVLCNVLGTKTLADLAVKYQVEKFVMVSTDKAVNPTNVMGCSKRIAEIYVQSLNRYIRNININATTSFITTRFGNVLGSNGSVIPYFKKQITKGGPITVTHPEITRYFMTIPEACQLVMEAGAMGSGGEIYVFDMGKSIKIVDLARKMVMLSGLKPDSDIEIVYTGLRKGEKLYEELLASKEDTIQTHNQKIMIARVREYSYEEINQKISAFKELLDIGDDFRIVALMKEIVPEFISQSSPFKVLDRKVGELIG
jgi:FlaA1/EpsC-like NDP-sugar epimerase